MPSAPQGIELDVFRQTVLLALIVGERLQPLQIEGTLRTVVAANVLFTKPV